MNADNTPTPSGDRLRMNHINKLPQPFTAKFFGGGEWPVHDIDVETGLLRIDVCGKLQVMHIGEVKLFRDADGVEHDAETFYSDGLETKPQGKVPTPDPATPTPHIPCPCTFEDEPCADCEGTPDNTPTPDFSTPAYPDGCPTLMMVEILRLRRELEEARVIQADTVRELKAFEEDANHQQDRAEKAEARVRELEDGMTFICEVNQLNDRLTVLEGLCERAKAYARHKQSMLMAELCRLPKGVTPSQAFNNDLEEVEQWLRDCEAVKNGETK